MLYIIASRATRRFAARYDDQRFMTIFLVGMAVRVFVALMLVTFAFVLVPVHPLAFVSSFLITFVAGMIFEVLELHRTGSESPPSRPLP